ncbi:MAG: transporter substrate-binding domain-containing protein [Chloroflexota bacterium]
MNHLRRGATLLASLMLVAACTPAGNGSASPSSAAASDSAAPSVTTVDIPAAVCVGAGTTYLSWLSGAENAPTDQDPITEPASATGDLLETIKANGKVRISTDANYKPQSFREPDGSWVGFDIDVGTEIAKRLGVTAEFQHVDFDIITAGSWASRWDISVGSMTITTDRKTLFSFTQPYYYTPAFMAASTRSGVTSVDQIPFELPSGAEALTRPTDSNCIEDIAANRPEFDLLITSGTVIDAAVDADQPIVKIGEPIFLENLAVAIDKSGPAHAALLFEIDKAIGEMHADGTLTTLSEKWFEGEDLTVPPGG